MPLPTLANWDATRVALHQSAQVLGAFRKWNAPRLPNALHLPLFVTPRGLTAPLAAGGALDLEFAAGRVVAHEPGGARTSIELAAHTQASLMDALAKLTGQQPDRAGLAGGDRLHTVPAHAQGYAEALYHIFTVLARVRARLIGAQTPLIVWPHGFDLSGLWFKRGFEERTDPHINIGFSPGSAGLPRPYIYLYASPQPPGLAHLPLVGPARWHTTGWTGVLIPYDALALEDDPEAALEGWVEAAFNALAASLSAIDG